MNTQLSLFEQPKTLDELFDEYHEANPHVYDAVLHLAQMAQARGIERWSIQGIFEVLRWESSIRTNSVPWKLNNRFRGHYARKVMREHPTLAAFFELRRLRSA